MDFKQHLHLIGLGLIGGSVARGLSGTEIRVTGWDNSRQVAEQALEGGMIEAVYPPDRVPSGVDGVMLAVPVPEMVAVMEQLVEGEFAGDYVTDVGSTKNWICQQAMEILPSSVEFVGGHPMAGSEKGGLEASDPLLFENAICVLTPTDRPGRGLVMVRQIWEKLGAHLMELSPDRHDRVVAHISHLPHIAAAGMIHTLLELPDYEEAALPLAAGGFRDTTRIAGSKPQLWRDIFATNRQEILQSLDEYKTVLTRLENALEQADWELVTDWLEAARRLRNRVPAKAKGLIGKLYELRIQAPDRPGILAEITGILGEAGINICDIEVLRVREGEKGTVRLAFRRPREFKQAREILLAKARGIKII